MFDFNQLQALKEMVIGQGEDEEIVQNFNKGSMLSPGDIGSGTPNTGQKEIARPYAKIQAKVGKKYEPSANQPSQKKTQKKQGKPNDIWTQEEISDLPVSKNDKRKQPQFEVLYRQRVGTEDVFLGLSGRDPSSQHCQEMMYKIKLPNTTLKEISLDITERAMVLQTKDFYLYQHFQYNVKSKDVKAKFITDKSTLQLVLPVIKQMPY